jgi:arylsulfatase B/arylsulfatase I/J
VSWHNRDIKSPNLDRLAREGIILENYYVQPICTPTRSALMTGYYPIHTGRQVPIDSVNRFRPLGQNIMFFPW